MSVYWTRRRPCSRALESFLSHLVDLNMIFRAKSSQLELACLGTSQLSALKLGMFGNIST